MSDPRAAVPGEAARPGRLKPERTVANFDDEGLERLGQEEPFEAFQLFARFARLKRPELLKEGEQAARLRVAEAGGQERLCAWVGPGFGG